MDVAVIGAAGAVGRQICTQLVERRVLPASSRLQLVGRAGGASGAATHGLRADLIDAYDEVAPLIDVASSADEVVADVVVVAGGATVPTDPRIPADREALARVNAAIFEDYARALATQGSGHEVVVVVSNPVELGVSMMAAALGRHRVIGMGAWLDTLRLRREIAASLGLRRHRIGGFAAGQHGNLVVPLWSSVRIAGLDIAERRAAVARVRGDRTLDTFSDEISHAQQELLTIASRDVGAAFALVETWPPDLRMVARPWMTHQSGARTAVATANATVDLVETLLDGREIVVAGQVALDGDISLCGQEVHGVLGVPVVLGPEGWTEVLFEPPAPDEERQLATAARRVVDSCAAAMLQVAS